MKKRTTNGKLIAGWQIERPTIGTGYMYQVTSKARPGVCKRFANMGQAERWALAHDVGAEDMALAKTEKRDPFPPFVVARVYSEYGRPRNQYHKRQTFDTYSEALQWAHDHTRPGLTIEIFDVNVRGGRYAEYTHEQLA